MTVTEGNMSPEQRQAKFREIAIAAAGQYPEQTDFTYRHEQVPYTLQRLRIALRVCAQHLIEHPTRVTLDALQGMYNDAQRLKVDDPHEFTTSIQRGEAFAQRRGLS